MKKLAWTALVTVVSAVASRVAVRALVRVWRRVTKEDPPAMPGWMKFLVGKTTNAVIKPT
jgi:hypothetical protein